MNRFKDSSSSRITESARGDTHPRDGSREKALTRTRSASKRDIIRELEIFGVAADIASKSTSIISEP